MGYNMMPMATQITYSQDFNCPLTYKLMLDPWKTFPCGHTFEKVPLQVWQKFQTASNQSDISSCPICKTDIKYIAPNHDVAKKISLIIDKNPELLKGSSLRKESAEWSVFPEIYEPADLPTDMDLVYQLDDPDLINIEIYFQTGDVSDLITLDESHRKRLYFFMHCLHRSQNKDVSDPLYGEKAFHNLFGFSSTSEERNTAVQYMLIEVLLKETMVKALRHGNNLLLKNCLLYLEQGSKTYAHQLHYILYQFSLEYNQRANFAVLPTHLNEYGRLAFRNDISAPTDLKIKSINDLLERLYRTWGA